MSVYLKKYRYNHIVNCLKCTKPFRSPSKFKRICPACKRRVTDSIYDGISHTRNYGSKRFIGGPET